jgi:hypothetical protein
VNTCLLSTVCDATFMLSFLSAGCIQCSDPVTYIRRYFDEPQHCIPPFYLCVLHNVCCTRALWPLFIVLDFSNLVVAAPRPFNALFFFSQNADVLCEKVADIVNVWQNLRSVDLGKTLSLARESGAELDFRCCDSSFMVAVTGCTELTMLRLV